MQMKRKAPDDLNGEQHKTRSERGFVVDFPCSLTTLWKSSFVRTQWRALRYMRHAPRTVGDERSFELLRECLDDDFTKISPMKMPQSVCVFERGGRKTQLNWLRW